MGEGVLENGFRKELRGFELARAAGGAIAWYWVRWRGEKETGVVVLASGLILGEGLCSIVNLILASLGTPHL